MKKLFVLTSVLAIAACGGGGGGSGGGGVAPISAPSVPAVFGDGITAAAQTSNESVTKMKGEVIVAENWGSPLTRGSSTNVGGVNFYQYELEDIRLLLADEVNTGQGYLNISMDDDGRIDAIKMMVGGVGADVARVGETNQFNGPIFEYVKDKYAKIGNTEFAASTSNTTGLLNGISQGMGFVGSGEGSGWKQVGDYWQFDLDGTGNYATWNPGGGDPEVYKVNNAYDPLKNAVKNANHFGEGKWVTVDGNYKYVEYGDQAVYRMVETATMDADYLAGKETEVKTAHPEIEQGHWNRVDEVMDVVTLGGDIDGAGTSLQYADFGHFNPVYKTKDIDVNGGAYGAWTNAGENKSHTPAEVNAELAAEDYQLFAGGYAITGISNGYSLAPENNTSYTGKAIGRVYTSIQGNNNAVRESHFAENGITSGDGHDIAKAFTTTAATMTIGADGKQTLFMPFYSSPAAGSDYYYDVTIVKNPDTSIETTFGSGMYTDTGATSAGNPIAAEYRLYNAEANMVPGQNTFSPRYYGVNTPSEAAGTAMFYSEENYGDGAKREYELQAAWGMKKD